MLDKDNQDFMKHANPWALRGIIELVKLRIAGCGKSRIRVDHSAAAGLPRCRGDLEDVVS